jgi:hypothetical protein
MLAIKTGHGHRVCCSVFATRKEPEMAMITAYTQARNGRFTNSSSNLVDLVTRLNDTIAAMPAAAQRNWRAGLKKALADFRKNNPNVKNFDRNSFPLCKAIDKNLCQIVIDTTMQREPDIKWVLHIISNFRAYQAQPIQVYDAGAGLYGGWDGQHTALALYLIAVFGLGMKFEDVMVPVNEYAMQTRGQLRGTFISNNSTTGKMAGKKPLDLIDIVQQMIYGVECDGVAEQEWVDMHTKWQHLRDAGMFLTADKFGDTGETGAISRLNELYDASVEVVRKFAVYGEYVIENQATARNLRPINTKEIPIIIEFLNMCEIDDIVLSDDDIRSMAQHCIDLFDANFDSKGPYWAQVYTAVVNAWTKYNKANAIPKQAWGDQPKNSKNVPMGISFFWHQMTVTWAPARKVKMPKRPNYTYQPDPKDLLA